MRVGLPRRAAVHAVVTAVIATALVTACSRPPDLRQARIENPVRGSSVNAQSGHLRLLATRVDAPRDRKLLEGSNTGIFTTIANDGDTPDRLEGVSTVYAKRVVMREGLDGPAQTVGVDIPGHDVVSLQYPGGLHLEMVDVQLDVRAGRILPVTFRFAKSGTVTVNVFVDGFGFPTVSPPSAPRG